MGMTLRLKYGKGYSGMWGHRCWVARITGTDQQYGLRREFLEPARVEREHFNRPRTMISCTYDVPAGLYEYSEAGERTIVIVCQTTGGWKRFVPSDQRLRAMLALMDAGQSAEEARLATKPEVPHA